MYKMKEDIVFVGVDVNETEHAFKSELDDNDNIDNTCSKDNSDEHISDEASSDGTDHDNDLDKSKEDENNISNENDHNLSEELVSISQLETEPGYINYEYLEDDLETETAPKSPKKTKRRAWLGQMSDDEDYVPPASIRLQKTGTVSEEILTDMVLEDKMAIELLNYKRSTRIGCCIFNDCVDDCISLIPRKVRREMAIQHNVYIPFLSKVCKEHLQDQNWEEISSTTTLFRADHCQDLKNIVTEASHTNFNFENIDTVDSKLVRYWFDLNKGDFIRIFNYFPKLKRLKEAKTVFAVYLMYLQNNSIKRIGLLLKMKEKAVKRRIMFVKDIVKCSTFKSFKQKFLEQD